MMKKHCNSILVFLCLVLALGTAGCVCSDCQPDTASAKKAKRRIFIRQMEDPRMKDELIRTFAEDPDEVIRQRVLCERFSRDGDKAYSALLARTKEKSLYVMRSLIECARHLKDPKLKQELLTKIAKENPFEEFRRMARQENFPFQRNNKRLKDDPSHDFAIETVKSFKIPDNNWKFVTDSAMEGHLKGYFKPSFPDSSWKKIRTGVWETQGFANYDGVAWYRIRFTMPPKIQSNAVELKFTAVDESAWVWLNGTYIGQHDKGPSGWMQTFHLDVRNEILWGQENILTVRVLDTAGGGGIYLPIHVEILR